MEHGKFIAFRVAFAACFAASLIILFITGSITCSAEITAHDGDALQLFEAALPQLRANHADQYDSAEKLQAAWKSFRETLALAQTARNRGLEDNPQMRLQMARILSEELILREAETAHPNYAISEEEIRKYFEANKDQFEVPAMLGTHEIVLSYPPGNTIQRNLRIQQAAKIASLLGTEVVELTTFIDCAKTYSDPDSYQSNGAYLGIFPAKPYHGQQAPLPEQVVDELARLKKVGGIMWPVDNGHEILILRLSAYRASISANYGSVKEAIRAGLYHEAREGKIRQLIAESGMDTTAKLTEEELRLLLRPVTAAPAASIDLPPSPGGPDVPVPKSASTQ